MYYVVDLVINKDVASINAGNIRGVVFQLKVWFDRDDLECEKDKERVYIWYITTKDKSINLIVMKYNKPN